MLLKFGIHKVNIRKLSDELIEQIYNKNHKINTVLTVYLTFLTTRTILP